MNADPILELTCEHRSGTRESIALPAFRCFCDGYTGRDRYSLEKHIIELETQLGVPRPARVPVCYPMMARLVQVDPGTIEVYGSATSGEIEVALIVVNGSVQYVGLGSDQTDREFERFSIPLAKNLCPKVLSAVVWPLDEVISIWDRLELRSWIDEEPYQDDTLGSMLPLEELVSAVPSARLTGNALIMSGTIPTLSGLRFGRHFRGSLTDPFTGRQLHVGYEVTVLDPIS